MTWKSWSSVVHSVFLTHVFLSVVDRRIVIVTRYLRRHYATILRTWSTIDWFNSASEPSPFLLTTHPFFLTRLLTSSEYRYLVLVLFVRDTGTGLLSDRARRDRTVSVLVSVSVRWRSVPIPRGYFVSRSMRVLTPLRRLTRWIDGWVLAWVDYRKRTFLKGCFFPLFKRVIRSCF